MASFGTITRWGSKGYGFIRPDDRAVDAWTHIRFFADADYAPERGDRVEFELNELPDGRFQARDVRLVEPAGGSRVREPAFTSPRAPLRYRLGDAIAGAHPLAAEPQREAARLPGMGDPLIGQEELSNQQEPQAAGVTRKSSRPPPVAPLSVSEELARVRRERDVELTALVERRDRLRGEATKLLEQADGLDIEIFDRGKRAGPADVEALRALLPQLALEFSASLESRAKAVRAVEEARAAAIGRAGSDAVTGYDEARKRARTMQHDGDQLARDAFALLETGRRAAVADYASALDNLDKVSPPRARYIVFVGPPDGAVTLVAPIATALAISSATPTAIARTACAFWHIAERCARELGGNSRPEHGACAGNLAVRLRVPPADLELLGMLAQESWSGRPSLEKEVELAPVEVVVGVAPPWSADDAEATVDGPGPLPSGRSVPHVAARLGVTSHDLVAMLYNYGLRFPDDEVDLETEVALRAALGGDDGKDAPPTEPPEDNAPGGPRQIASRLLAKLRRARVIGGKHVRFESAYAHGFADAEKPLARAITEFFLRHEILLGKPNEGTPQVCINPRRLREVGQIVDGKWDRSGELDGLT